MAQNIRIYILLLLFYLTLITAFGQSEIGVNLGYIKPLLLTSTDDPHYSGSVDYSGSAFITLKYKEKATNHMFLGIDLTFNNYNLDFIERQGSHFGSFKKNINYRFNYLYTDFYPEWVFGSKIKYCFHIGITFGILLNSNMTGTTGGPNLIELPDGHWYFEYDESYVEGSAKDDLRGFNVGINLGNGLEYSFTTNWSAQINMDVRFLPFPVDNGFAKSQMDLLISAGATYTINKNKKPLLFRSGFQQ